MSVQLILRIAGIAALVFSALFAMLAVHYYLSQDIKGVMDDLSGKARARGVAGARKRAHEASRPAAARSGRVATATPVERDEIEEAPRMATDSPVPSAPMPMLDEDDVDTVLVAATVRAGESTAGGAVVPSEAGEVAAPAYVRQKSQTTDASVLAGEAAGAAPAIFRLTRSIVMIHSQEVIAASGE